MNAATAVACLEHFPNLVIEADALARGLITAEWPARLQRLDKGKLLESLPSNWQLWLDGGHNGSAGEILGAQLKTWKNEAPDRPILVIAGMLNTKNPKTFFAPMQGFVKQFYTVAIPDEQSSLSALELAEAGELNNAQQADSVSAALQLAKQLVPAHQDCLILICGSLYLAGAVLAENHFVQTA
jgi:dihydrofolate synthase/folylpolyglutamate synthase